MVYFLTGATVIEGFTEGRIVADFDAPPPLVTGEGTTVGLTDTTGVALTQGAKVGEGVTFFETPFGLTTSAASTKSTATSINKSPRSLFFFSIYLIMKIIMRCKNS
jgi:hypothetical protein